MDWNTHEEDVWFEFEGSQPEQLEPGRYYRGTVDGFADFGVFVDIGDHVTGLLHQSELDTRLESLDWNPGDGVFVQVKGIRDNGDIDLGWSIRQAPEEFRGHRVHDPHADDDEDDHNDHSDGDGGGGHDPEVRSVPRESTPSESTDGDDGDAETDAAGHDAAATDESESESESGSEHESEDENTDESASANEGADASEDERTGAPEERTPVDELGDRVGDVVLLEGIVVEARQTSGPTIFEVRDETGPVECAAFEAAGVRAYPDVEVDDAVALVGEVERRHGELQVETESLERLDGEEEAAVQDRLAEAIREAARAPELDPPVEDDSLDGLLDQAREVATAIRAAVIAGKPVVVRHSQTVDGYVAGVAIERATLPLVREEHPAADAEYHLFERRPLEDRVYDMDAATDDVTDMLERRERHGESLPLVVVVDAGATEESTVGYGLLDVYDVDHAVVAGEPLDAPVRETVTTAATPDREADLPTAALATTVAHGVDPDAADDLGHLPALPHWGGAPESYRAAAAEAGYDADRLRTLREAVAFGAYFQSYEDKREIFADLLFDSERGERFAAHLSEEFRDRLDEELAAAERNLRVDGVDGVDFAVLDTEAFTHRFDFPPTDLLLDEIHRSGVDGDDVVVGFGEDTLRLRSDDPVDLRAVAAAAAERAPEAGIDAVGGRDGHVEYLLGERDAALDAVEAAVADHLAASEAADD
ncbi:DNA-binding protein [Halobacteriales archaeon SW_7_71_33]|nr:MAG: DNA-binding protein [Halobacteriales archaeon SW_7_71_33]